MRLGGVRLSREGGGSVRYETSLGEKYIKARMLIITMFIISKREAQYSTAATGAHKRSRLQPKSKGEHG